MMIVIVVGATTKQLLPLLLPKLMMIAIVVVAATKQLLPLLLLNQT